ncbi:hypothetical protein [Shewanella mangrovisoli]|uniref:hypothetical protein n=1 Tax=Shewanella mangrovisoli TaxID=2864211 RepID=UPI001C65EDCB|nr:hypothetical protein [Shewanella mangrovisoli]QYK08982.1 hypothetical protein K0H60_19660 [Shewanella mangrovisoli]
MKNLLIFTFLLLPCFVFAANEIKVQADLEFLLDTEKESGKLCFGETDCSTWSTFYLFNAKVKKVIVGTEPNASFKVIYGRHALLKQDLNGAVITLRELDKNNGFGAKYQVVNIE